MTPIRRTTASLLAIILLAAALVATPARARTITQQKQYVGAIDTPSRTLEYVSCAQAPYIGGACFNPPQGATTVSFDVADATTTHPGGIARFLDANGKHLAEQPFCDQTSMPVAPGTDRIQIFVNGPGTGLSACAQSGVGTTGTITATFEIGDSGGGGGGGGTGYIPSQPVYDVIADAPQYVTSSAGDQVEVDVYRPDGPGPFPVIVWFDVYYKDDTGAVVNDERNYFVSRGYVFVQGSSPGSNASCGAYDVFGPEEQAAATSVVEWAGTQPWSNGKVAMEGLSYAAIIEYFVAAHHPADLVTIYPTSAYSDLYRDIAYTGGNLQAGYPVEWDANNRTTAYAPPQRVSSDPQTQATCYATAVSGWRPIAAQFAPHPYADDFYAVRSPVNFDPQIDIPVAIDAGWYDDMVYGAPVNFESIGSATKRFIIGPWSHSGAHRRPDGRFQRLRWMDHYLKGMPSGVDTDPRAQVFVPNDGNSTDGTWISGTDWPLPDTAYQTMYLGDGALAGAPQPSGSSSYLYSPTRYTESVQTIDAGESIRFETAPLTSDVTVAGYPEVDLYGATSAPDTSWNVALYDVAPDGSSTLLQRGWVRAAARAWDPARSVTGRPYLTFQSDQPVPANQPVEYRIPVWPFANRFTAGHRIRLEFSDSRAGDGGAPAAMPLHPGTNTVLFGGATPSRLLLPVIPNP